MSPIALTTTAAFQALLMRYKKVKNQHMRDLFAADPHRFKDMSIKIAGILLDYSKNRIDKTTWNLLLELAREREVVQKRNAMFYGEKINITEHRAALHTALRSPLNNKILQIDKQYLNQDVHKTLNRIQYFVECVRQGKWRGFSGKIITDIVNIGIGGSYLGPKMTCTALRSYVDGRFNMHFVSNVDGHNLDEVLHKIKCESTLFIIASKTFTTQETMINAKSARSWFLQHAEKYDLHKHFIAVSTHEKHVNEFGIDTVNMFPLWDWVGGRYSLWSSIGLSIALAIGFNNFSDFLAGAHAMDKHFCSAPLEKNMPVILALVGIWNRNFFNNESLLIVPYHHDLRYFPAYLQQLEMESNGKHITCDGKPVSVATCPFIWGDVGTNSQHAFFQLVHQGTNITPIDFIAVLRPTHKLHNHHIVLLANCIAQSEALMQGSKIEKHFQVLYKNNIHNQKKDCLMPHKTFEGNRPSNTILLDTLTPMTLGALIALYEHKTFVQGVIWNVNSFDQWGVELGKILANTIQAELSEKIIKQQHDNSTCELINIVKQVLPELELAHLTSKQILQNKI